MSPHIQNMLYICLFINYYYYYYYLHLIHQLNNKSYINTNWNGFHIKFFVKHKQNQCTLEFASKFKNFIYKQNKTQSKKYYFKSYILFICKFNIQKVQNSSKCLWNIKPNLHNLCTNEHKNLHVKNLWVHICNILFIIAMNKNIFCILYINWTILHHVQNFTFKSSLSEN